MGAGASCSAESQGDIFDALSSKWDELASTDQFSGTSLRKPECYEDMLKIAIPETPGVERNFYLELRSEFMTLVKESAEVLWVGDEDANDKPASIQEAFARRKKSSLSDAELNKRHRRTMKKAAAADTGPFTASS